MAAQQRTASVRYVQAFKSMPLCAYKSCGSFFGIGYPSLFPAGAAQYGGAMSHEPLQPFFLLFIATY